MKWEKFSEQEILDLSIDRPEALFDQDDLKNQIRRIRRRWHPDQNEGKTDSVFAKIEQLIVVAEKKIENDEWNGPGEVMLPCPKDSTYLKLKYRFLRKTDLGKSFVGKTRVLNLINDANIDLARAGERNLASLKFANAEMEKEFKRYLPDVEVKRDTVFGRAEVLKKTEDVIPLQVLLDHTNGSLSLRHVAWIGNALLNLAMFLNYNNLTYNAFTTEDVWVSPKYHTILLLTGWSFSEKSGSRIQALPSELINSYTRDQSGVIISSSEQDRRAIKRLMIQCLGDPSGAGTKLLQDPDIAKNVATWLMLPPDPSPLKDFQKWMDLMLGVFGKRNFVKLPVDLDKIYELNQT